MGDIQESESISKEFLETSLGKKIRSYKITPGTNSGDNYFSVMYSIEVDFDENEKKAYLLLKCFPSNPTRQDILVNTNLFWRELSFYKEYIPKLVQMQKDMNLTEIIKPTFPPFVAGSGINYYTEPFVAGKIYSPFDNYVMMVDVRKTFGFKMANRLESFDCNQVAIFMKSLARNHALGWVYKKRNNLTRITEHFPFMSNDYSLQPWKTFIIDLAIANGKKGSDTVEKVLGSDSPITEGFKKFLNKSTEILNIQYCGFERNEKEFDKYFRVKPQPVIDEQPWNVPLLGDTWANNILFKYNTENGFPEETIHVDLQMCTEGCPTTDLVYMLYISTDSEFRKRHLNEMLSIYVNTFKEICQLLNTESLPNFTVEEFKRRVHRSKLYGVCLGVLSLPTTLMEADKMEDMESKEGGNMTEMISSISNKVNKRYVDRIVALASELYEEGII